MKKFSDIIADNSDAIEEFNETSELIYGSNLYNDLYEYYLYTGEMPISVAKARTGDPVEWICNKLECDRVLS